MDHDDIEQQSKTRIRVNDFSIRALGRVLLGCSLPWSLACTPPAAGSVQDPAAANAAPASAGADSAAQPSSVQAVSGAPAEYLDLNNWKLTLPFGEPHHPTEIKQPVLASFSQAPYFFLSDKGVVFRAHAGGVTTPNSSYPRTELREMMKDGKERAAWSTSQGRHTMIVTATIMHVPVAKPHVVAAQLHDATDDVVMIRLERDHLFVEAAGNNLGTLDANYQLGTPFTAMIDASDGRVRVYFNDMSQPRVDVERKVSGCYFKAGAYTQSNPTKGDTEDAFGEVTISQLAVRHQ